VKRTCTSIFIPIIKIIENNGKVIVDVMDCINIVQLDINKGGKIIEGKRQENTQFKPKHGKCFCQI
jgi:hypothetical protein